MKKISKPAMIGAVSLLAALTLTGCMGERPVDVAPVETPVSEQQKAVIVTPLDGSGKDKTSTQTGWTQLKDSIEVSLSGPEDCLPEIEKAVRDGKTVSLYLKDGKDDCTNTKAITYFTVEDAKNIEKVQMYEAGYKIPFEMFKLPSE